jgi:hypothetical protein
MKPTAAIILVGIVALLAMAVPADAKSRSYYIGKREAEADTRQAVRERYREDYGIHGILARCRPQFVRYDPDYDYHRWVCGWAGWDYDEDIAYGRLRITGQSGGYFGHHVLSGIRWE